MEPSIDIAMPARGNFESRRRRRVRRGSALSLLFCGAISTGAAMVYPDGAVAQTAIEVSLGDVSLNKVAFLVAADNGLYAKYGLAVHQFITQQAASRVRRSGIEVPAEFIGTSQQAANAPIDIGGGSPMIVKVTTDARATDRVIVATTDASAKFHIISSKDIASLDDLKGKRLGYSVTGSVSHLMALALLQRKNWSPERDISLMSEGMAYPALKSGRVDAFIGSSIYYTMAEKNGARDLLDLGQFDIPIAGSGVNVERKWLAGNRDTVERFLKSMIEAYALMSRDKGVVRDALVKWYNITDPKQQDGMYAKVLDAPHKPYPAVDGINLVMKLFTHRELQRYQPEHFYDASFIAALDKSGFIDAAYSQNAAKR